MMFLPFFLPCFYPSSLDHFHMTPPWARLAAEGQQALHDLLQSIKATQKSMMVEGEAACKMGATVLHTIKMYIYICMYIFTYYYYIYIIYIYTHMVWDLLAIS